MYLIRFSVFLSPEEEDNLRHCNGPEEDEYHLRVHQVVSPMSLLHHAVTKPVRLLGTELAPVHLVPVERRGARLPGNRRGAVGSPLVCYNWKLGQLLPCSWPRKASQRLTLLTTSEREESVAPPAPPSTATSAIFEIQST